MSTQSVEPFTSTSASTSQTVESPTEAALRVLVEMANNGNASTSERIEAAKYILNYFKP